MFYNAKRIITIMVAFFVTATGCTNFTSVIYKPQKIMAEYYVSVDGSDSNTGTAEAPFATIERARDEVRKVNNNMTGNIVVHIGEGTYNLSDTIVFDERDSASGDWYIRYIADGNALVSGGDKINGFTLYDAENNIYSAAVKDGTLFRQLYMNGEKLIRSRSNGDYSTKIIGASRFYADGTMIPENLNRWDETSLVQADYGEIYLKADEFKNFNNLEDVELHILTAWVKNVLRVKSAETNDDVTIIRIQDEENGLIFNRPHPDIDGYSHMNNREFTYYIENAYELIDEDNEWYLDEATATVYIKVPEGTDMSTAEVIAPKLETLMKLEPTNESKIKNLSFENLTFAYSNWTVPSTEGLVDIQGGMYANYCIFATNDIGVLRPSAAIYAADTENLIIKGCTIENIGAAGLDLAKGTKNSLVQDNIIRNISGNGIMVAQFAVDENTDMHIVYNTENESDICDGDRIVNNLVTNIGTDYQSSVAIGAGYPRNILIANNEVSYAPYTGISVGFGWSAEDSTMRNNRILNNDIHHTSQVLCDAGGIYTLSKQPDSEISGNYIHDIYLPEWADYATSGIYMDEQTAGYTVKYNVIEHGWGVGRNRNGENDYKEKTIYIDKKQTSRIKAIKKNAGINKNFDVYAKLFY